MDLKDDSHFVGTGTLEDPPPGLMPDLQWARLPLPEGKREQENRMRLKKQRVMEHLREIYPVFDQPMANTAWDELEKLEAGITDRIKTPDLAALIGKRMREMAAETAFRNQIEATARGWENRPLTFRSVITDKIRRSGLALAEFKKRIGLAALIIWTGGLP